MGQTAGWVSVGVDHDTAAFAQSIRRGWESMGATAYPQAGKLLINSRFRWQQRCQGHMRPLVATQTVRLWKPELQKLSDETGLELSVCRLPPGSSKWNKASRAAAAPVPPQRAGRV